MGKARSEGDAHPAGEPGMAQLLDPLAWERRVAEARARRAEALAKRGQAGGAAKGAAEGNAGARPRPRMVRPVPPVGDAKPAAAPSAGPAIRSATNATAAARPAIDEPPVRTLRELAADGADPATTPATSPTPSPATAPTPRQPDGEAASRPRPHVRVLNESGAGLAAARAGSPAPDAPEPNTAADTPTPPGEPHARPVPPVPYDTGAALRPVPEAPPAPDEPAALDGEIAGPDDPAFDAEHWPADGSGGESGAESGDGDPARVDHHPEESWQPHDAVPLPATIAGGAGRRSSRLVVPDETLPASGRGPLLVADPGMAAYQQHRAAGRGRGRVALVFTAGIALGLGAALAISAAMFDRMPGFMPFAGGGTAEAPAQTAAPAAGTGSDTAPDATATGAPDATGTPPADPAIVAPAEGWEPSTAPAEMLALPLGAADAPQTAANGARLVPAEPEAAPGTAGEVAALARPGLVEAPAGPGAPAPVAAPEAPSTLAAATTGTAPGTLAAPETGDGVPALSQAVEPEVLASLVAPETPDGATGGPRPPVTIGDGSGDLLDEGGAALGALEAVSRPLGRPSGFALPDQPAADPAPDATDLALATPGPAEATDATPPDAAAAGSQRIIVHAPSALSGSEVDSAAAAIETAGFAPSARVAVPFAVGSTNVRYYHSADAAAAEAVAAALSSNGNAAVARDFTGHSPRPAAGTVEVYLAGAPRAAPAVASSPPAAAPQAPPPQAARQQPPPQAARQQPPRQQPAQQARRQQQQVSPAEAAMRDLEALADEIARAIQRSLR